MDSEDAGAAGGRALTTSTERVRPGVQLVRAGGRLDRWTARDLRHLLVAQIAASPWAVVLDLSALTALEPVAVPTLVHLAAQAAEADVGLYLVVPDHSLDNALATAEVQDLFDVHPTVDAAVRALSAPPR